MGASFFYLIPGIPVQASKNTPRPPGPDNKNSFVWGMAVIGECIFSGEVSIKGCTFFDSKFSNFKKSSLSETLYAIADDNLYR